MTGGRLVRPIAAITVLAGLLLVAGCATYTLVQRGERVSLGGAFDLDPQRAWSRLSTGKIETWTVDGTLLHSVSLYKGIEDGAPIVTPQPSLTAKDLPRFEKEMTSIEIRELIEATIAKVHNVTIRPLDTRSWSFGGTDGFRFEFRYRSKEGLNMRTSAVGTILEDKLYLIGFTGADLHYYDTYLKDVEAMIASIKKT